MTTRWTPCVRGCPASQESYCSRTCARADATRGPTAQQAGGEPGSGRATRASDHARLRRPVLGDGMSEAAVVVRVGGVCDASMRRVAFSQAGRAGDVLLVWGCLSRRRSRPRSPRQVVSFSTSCGSSGASTSLLRVESSSPSASTARDTPSSIGGRSGRTSAHRRSGSGVHRPMSAIGCPRRARTSVDGSWRPGVRRSSSRASPHGRQTPGHRSVRPGRTAGR